MHRISTVDVAARLHIEIELAPKDASLDKLALSVGDPQSPDFHRFLTRDAFVARFGRAQSELDTLAALLRTNNARDVYVSSNRLLVGGNLSIADAERAFHTTYAAFEATSRVAVAPTTPLTLPVANIRAVRGVVTGFSPRLADANTGAKSDFRGAWYLPQRFSEVYDTLDGDGARLTLIEDASDRHDQSDIELFLRSAGAPKGALAQNVRSTVFVEKPQGGSVCGRDDRGQEPTLDIDSIFTIAPMAHIDVRYDDVCGPGNDGSVALQRALDDANTTEIVFPFALAPVITTVAEDFGPIPIPYLEAAVRGIPVIVPSGDDGAFGVRLPGIQKPAVTYPCVLPIVICVGGTQVGERRTGGALDEGPWNDDAHASGGGISNEARPSWQVAPGAFEFTPASINKRIVPDIAADASGHLRIFWKKYALGGIGGTSESVSIAGAQIAAINAKVPTTKRLLVPADIYALAQRAPQAFHDVSRDNDRGYLDNTLRPPPPALPLNYKGVLPTPPPLIYGCAEIEPRGCVVKVGYDAVTGIGSLKGKSAADALR